MGRGYRRGGRSSRRVGPGHRSCKCSSRLSPLSLGAFRAREWGWTNPRCLRFRAQVQLPFPLPPHRPLNRLHLCSTPCLPARLRSNWKFTNAGCDGRRRVDCACGRIPPAVPPRAYHPASSDRRTLSSALLSQTTRADDDRPSHPAFPLRASRMAQPQRARLRAAGPGDGNCCVFSSLAHGAQGC